MFECEFRVLPNFILELLLAFAVLSQQQGAGQTRGAIGLRFTSWTPGPSLNIYLCVPYPIVCL